MSKKKRTGEPVARTSANVSMDQIERLREIFPECVTEGKIDFGKLQAALGEEIDSRPERYSFSWAGKREAIRLLQTPSHATLIPSEKESVKFDKTGNLFIEGDNLEVLKLLYKPYFGRVKMIYIDPPYNTGNDFIYPDNFADPLDTYLKITGQKSAEGNLLTTNPESSGRYHSAWLSMMYPRLFLARQLLREDGVIFVSIDDHELHNLLCIMNEIFGEENHLGTFIWVKKKKGSHLSKTLRSMTEYVVSFAHRKNSVELFGEEAYADKWQYLLNRPNKVSTRSFKADAIECSLPEGKYETGIYGESDLAVKLLNAVIVRDGRIKNDFRLEGRFKWSQRKIDEELSLGTRIAIKSKGFGPNLLRHDQSDKIKRPTTLLNTDAGIGTNEDANEEMKTIFGREGIIEYPKPTSLIKYLVNSTTYWSEDGIILDFFAGSCTTAEAVFQLNHEDGGNRRFIMVQLPEPTPEDSTARKAGFKTISEIGKERIRRAIKKLKKIDEGKLDLNTRETEEDLGFKVFELEESNYKLWKGVEEKDPNVYAKTMELFIDPLVQDWKPENLIWEVAIKEGYVLNARIELVSGINGNAVYRVTDSDNEQSFRICLDDTLKPATLKPLNLRKDDLFICRDAAMDDEVAANLALQCRLKTI